MKILSLLLLFSIVGFGQNPYPRDYFRSPLDIPLQLSGNFGELRPNHFHSGFDFKTQKKEGLHVYASAEGYVSRIKISEIGYGKAIYITHPNGFTTVYGTSCFLFYLFIKSSMKLVSIAVKSLKMYFASCKIPASPIPILVMFPILAA